MNIIEKLQKSLVKIQEPAFMELPKLEEIKIQFIKAQMFEEAAQICKIEKLILQFISEANAITNYEKTQSRINKLKEIFKETKE